HEIELRAVIVVETEVKIELAAEICADIVGRRQNIPAEEFVCQCAVIPGTWQRGAWEVSRHAQRAGATEHVCSEGNELRLNTNRHTAVEPSGPDSRCMLEGYQPLLT